MRSAGPGSIMKGVRGRLPASMAVAAALVGTLVASSALAQVVVITPEKRMASASTTIMLNPFYLAQNFSMDEVHSIEAADGGVTLSHPELGMNFFTATVTPDGSMSTGCKAMTEYGPGELDTVATGEVAR